MRRKVLVTGGNGFVGREVVRRLYDEHEVCVVDNLRSGPVRLGADELAKIRFSEIDIIDAAAVDALMADFKPDAIIHLAAIHYIPECENNPALAVKTNVDGTLNLLAAAPSSARFVFASSGAVYKPDDKPHLEDEAVLGPSDVYGFTKLHGEQYVRYFAAQRGLSAVNVRLFNVVGPGETNPHLLPEIIAQLKAGRTTLRLGNMTPKRDYIHVRDAASGFITVALKDDIEDGNTLTVNLGTSQSYSVAELVAKLKSVTMIDFALEQEQSRLRKVDRPHLAADIGRIASRFGWVPKATIDDALADAWKEPDMTAELAGKYR
ncbi:NAD-dependent epimerase/dehydratase family protein [Hyphomicrobium sp.]|uniref:NAD-dependent epimerase/dehydratase family protein n=1 Tax=Hyphomicrobium sp. TaxID=82 RepID=UPI0025BDCBD7|nr:NAD-dependent epimerase/dehydratase family protein [Hyphomicrobium sp.]MCC7250778.1 NAD-dependent epimerase/dehydratase family protein [Hyphomicrobium sp.]